MRSVAVRLLAGTCALAALCAVLPVAVGSLFVVLLSAARPDPDAPPGDPCCAPPESWAHAIGGTAYGVGGLAIAAGLVPFAAACFRLASDGHLPAWAGRRRVRRLAVAWAALLVAAVSVAVAAQLVLD